MECLKCKSDAILDRVVVDGVTEEPIGALCDSCQPSNIKLTFNDDVWHDDSGCAICADQAHYFLPELELRIEYETERPDTIEYSITESSPRLCMGHFTELLEGKASDAAVTHGAVSH